MLFDEESNESSTFSFSSSKLMPPLGGTTESENDDGALAGPCCFAKNVFLILVDEEDVKASTVWLVASCRITPAASENFIFQFSVMDLLQFLVIFNGLLRKVCGWKFGN